MLTKQLSYAKYAAKALPQKVVVPQIYTIVCVDSEANPLQWWNDHQEMFSNLKNVAKKYLCVPATSSPSKRVFSTSGNIVTCHRASLKPHAVDRLEHACVDLHLNLYYFDTLY